MCPGLNGIQMMCGRLTEDTYETIIRSVMMITRMIDDDNDDGREYEGPFGEWHEEHLCKPKEFLKQGQQNYQSYQGMFAGNFTFK